jgi:hypothetical protein
MDPLMPPPVRRIEVDREPHVAPPRSVSNGAASTAVAATRLRTARPAPAEVRERMRIGLACVW